MERKQGNERKHSAALFGCRKEQLRPVAMIVLMAMLLTLLPVSALAEDRTANLQHGVTLNLLTNDVAVTTPSGIFSTLTLSVDNQVVDNNGNLQLNFAFTVEDAVKQALYEQATSGSIYSFEDYEGEDYDAYLNGCSDEDLSPLEFSFILNSDMQIQLAEAMTAPILLQDGTQIGTFTVNPQNESGKLLFDCSLNKSLYNSTVGGISGGGVFTVQFSRTDLENQHPVLEWSEHQAIVTITFPDAPAVDVSGTNFTVTKETTNAQYVGGKKIEQAAPYLNYKVTLAAEKKDDSSAEPVYLNGLLLEDAIPAGLQLTDMTVCYTCADGKTTQTTQLTAQDYQLNQGKLLYKMPQEPQNITEAVFTMHTGLNETQYQKYWGSGVYKLDATNIARLLLPGEPMQELGNATVKDTISHSFLQKAGKEVGLNSRKFVWAVQVSAYFENSADVYLVDCIDNPLVHQFNPDTETLTLMKDGKSQTIATTPMTGAGFGDYNQITAAQLNTLNIMEGNAVCYNVESNGTLTQQLLIVKLPQAWCQGEFTLEYQTDVLAAVTEKDSKLQNKVKLVWGAVSGAGNVTVSSPNWSVNKTLSANHAIVSKTGVGYDDKTQTVTWSFDVNEYGTQLNEVTIVDKVDTSQYQLLDVQNQQDILVQPYNRTSGAASGDKITVPYRENADTATENYYTLVQQGDEQILTIHFAEIPQDTLYRFQLRTKVVNAADLLAGSKYVDGIAQIPNTSPTSTKTQGGEVNNTIAVTAVDGNGTYTQEVSATQSLAQGWMDKWSNRGYSASDHEIRWFVVPNSSFLPITNMVITDTLPVGMTYQGLASAATCGAGEVSGEQGIVNAAGTEIAFPTHGVKLLVACTPAADVATQNEIVTFTVTDMDGNANITTTCKFQLVLRAAYPTAYSCQYFENGKRVDAINYADLNGSIYGQPFRASVLSGAAFTPSLLTKDGIYHAYTADKPAYISWTVTVNSDRIDLGLGMGTEYDAPKIVDALHHGMDLRKDSLQITVNNKDVTEDFSLDDVTPQGFTIPIPEAYRNQCLKLTFDTQIVDDMTKEQMNNQVTILCPQRADLEAGKEAQNAQNFSLSAFAEMSQQPMLVVRKVSTHQVQGQDVLLDGAEFTLTKGISNADGWEFPAENAVAKVTRAGKVSYLGLQKDVVYQLQETATPAGYKQDNTIRYLLFTDTPEKYTKPTIQNVAVEICSTADKKNLQTITISNVPTKGSIVGYKQNDDGAGVADAKIGLFAEDTTDFTKDTALQYTESGDDGQFEFSGLTEGTYLIREITAPQGYYLNNTSLRVTLTAADCAPDHDAVTVDADSNPIVIVNEVIPTQGEIVGHKADQNGKRLADATITLTGVNYSQSCVTDVEGKFQFAGLQPGTYQLTETKAPQGYELSAQSFTVTLTPQDCQAGAAAIVMGFEKDDEILSPDIAEQPVPLTFIDERQALFGVIEGQKQDENGAPLAGATIGLFPAEATIYTEATALQTALTKEDGVFRFAQLQPGHYQVRELCAPQGYQNNDISLIVGLTTEDCRAGVPVTETMQGTALVIVNSLLVQPPSGGNGGTTEPPETTEPTVPPEVTEPTEPTDPTEPEEPVIPADPTEPEQPEQPSVPVEPELPVPPIVPTEPVTPEQPTVSVPPEYPTELPDANAPDSPDEITIWEDGVPTTYVKMWDPIEETYVYILEEDVPLFELTHDLGDAPETSDNAPITAMLLLLAVSAAGLRVVTRKKTE